MKHIIKQSQLASLRKALAKIERAGPEEIISLTDAEWEAYHNQSPVWEDSKTVPGKGDRTLARLVRRNNENPAQWSAGEWGYANRPHKEHLALRASTHNKMDINAGWTYQVEEREVQDGEEY